MAERREYFEIDIQATPEEIWQRLTTTEGLTSWFGTRAEIDLRIDGERIVGWGDGMEISARISDLEPQVRLKVEYLADGEETGAEEWLISRSGGSTRLTLIYSLSDDGIEDWEGFIGDIRRGWKLFMASMRFALTRADTPDRDVECTYLPARGPRSEIWSLVDDMLSSSDLVEGMDTLISIPPHSRLLVANDRTLLLDIEGAGPGQVLYVQAATHGGKPEWRARTIALARSGFESERRPR